MVELYMDQRADCDGKNIWKCTVAAVHANWISSGSSVNDFSVVKVDSPLPSQIRYKTTPIENSIPGNTFGFPKDMPDNAKGKHLCMSSGVLFYPSVGDGMISHMMNTEHGECDCGLPFRAATDDNNHSWVF